MTCYVLDGTLKSPHLIARLSVVMILAVIVIDSDDWGVIDRRPLVFCVGVVRCFCQECPATTAHPELTRSCRMRRTIRSICH